MPASELTQRTATLTGRYCGWVEVYYDSSGRAVSVSGPLLEWNGTVVDGERLLKSCGAP